MTRRANKEARVLVAEMASAIKDAMVDAILEVRALDVELDDLVDDSVNGLTAEVELLQGQLDTAKVEAEGLQNDLDEAQARIGELEKELDQVAADRRDIKGRLEIVAKERDEWQSLAERYKFDLGGKVSELETLQARFDNLNLEKKRLQADFDRKVKECDANLPAGNANRAAIADLQGKLNALDVQYQKAVADYQAIAAKAEPSEEVDALNGEVASLKKKLAGALQQLTAQTAAKTVMTGAFQDQLTVNERITTLPADTARSWVMTEAAETIMLLAAKGLNDQQIAARFNVGRPMNQQINGPAVTLIRALVERLAA
ncbi:emm-like protein [Asticcacaulis biprosthecium C19]|uniref:Emm-like protein n=1 Tax=Asticcacaulis biprosthecium C19 TaxID=715226 RepID=F4QGD1_9CAUL|nr:hypothetical protein [Asticcacaulis biprosthecium]EGF92459.1 emm-like protein [Asticcacaulis biprosthecium C19]